MSVTIKDVAKRANTSTATVSKVMNGSYSISEATCQRVKQAMEELDYHPNQTARTFAKQATKAVVFLSEMDQNSGYSNPQLFEIMCGLEKTLSKKGYALIMKSIHAKDTPVYVEEAIRTKLCDGFVIHASVISEELDDLIFGHQIPHIVIGTPNFQSHLCWIDIDNRLAGEMAVTHLFRQGYQRVAFIGGAEDDNISNHRLHGIQTVYEKHGLAFGADAIRYSDSSPDSAYACTMELLKSRRRTDAIICANNYIAYGCHLALKDMNVGIPTDVGLVTFDDYPFSTILKPQLTVVGIDVFDVGEQAGKYILQKIKKPNTYVQSYITVPTLIARASSLKK